MSHNLIYPQYTQLDIYRIPKLVKYFYSPGYSLVILHQLADSPVLGPLVNACGHVAVNMQVCRSAQGTCRHCGDTLVDE